MHIGQPAIDGDAERVLGGFIGTLVKRDDVFLATKAGITFRDGSRHISNSRNELISDLDRSLSRLNVDYIDLWQLNSWDKNTPLEETLSAFEAIREKLVNGIYKQIAEQTKVDLDA